jgi:hypothetical protein
MIEVIILPKAQRKTATLTPGGMSVAVDEIVRVKRTAAYARAVADAAIALAFDRSCSQSNTGEAT